MTEQAADLNYNFLEEIGHGGMGIVFRATHAQEQQPVAIKILHPELHKDDEQVQRFHREARSLEKTKHPNIVSFIGLYEQNEKLGIIMELLTGCSLKQYIYHHGPLSNAEVHYVMAQVIQGLSAAHVHNITHRDLKPSNIFLCDDGTIKLMDFGLAKDDQSHDDITQSGQHPIGSYYFMAPEQILGQPIDSRSDLYSLGVCLFKLATGKLPFSGDAGGEFEVMDKQVRQEPEKPENILSDISPELSAIILKLLEKEPDKRFQNCTELAESLEQLDPCCTPSLNGKNEIKKFSDLQFIANQTLSMQSHELNDPQQDKADKVLLNTILWAFEHNSPDLSKSPPLDLIAPPSILPETLKKLRQAITTIPPLPEIWFQIQEVLSDVHASASDIAKLVEKDPILSAHILKVCNSAAYAIVGNPPITHIALALTRLGMDAAQDVVLQMVMPELAPKKSPTQVQHLCFHAQAIALLTRSLADSSQIIERQSASLFGMLHDIGKLVILHIEEEKLETLAEKIAAGVDPLKAEWEVLGYTHIDAGMMLALHWKLPRNIHHFIYFHHHPCWHQVDTWPTDVKPAIMLIHVAHLMLASMLKNLTYLPDKDGIWQHQKRSHVPDSKALLNRPLHLPVNSISFYNQLEQDIKHLSFQFPDIFPCEVLED
ncbi:MAG: protein kinase [Mariprofundaceae bacterium]